VLYKKSYNFIYVYIKFIRKYFFFLCFLLLVVLNLINFINYHSSQNIAIFVNLTKKSTLSLSIPFYDTMKISPTLKEIHYEY